MIQHEIVQWSQSDHHDKIPFPLCHLSSNQPTLSVPLTSSSVTTSGALVSLRVTYNQRACKAMSPTTSKSSGFHIKGPPLNIKTACILIHIWRAQSKTAVTPVRSLLLAIELLQSSAKPSIKHSYFMYLVQRPKYTAPHKICLVEGGQSWHRAANLEK